MREIKFRFFDKLKDTAFLSSECNSYEVWDLVDDKERFITMQYTGLTDKNGVEIYEGDVFYGDDRFHEVVVYSGNKFMIEPQGDDCIDWNECVVIGNIYQNPELLE